MARACIPPTAGFIANALLFGYLNHAVSIALGQQFVHSRHNPGREGVNKGSGTGQPS